VAEISRSIAGINETTRRNSEESERLFGNAREVNELAVSLQRKMTEMAKGALAPPGRCTIPVKHEDTA
jgi:hypothetical protein